METHSRSLVCQQDSYDMFVEMDKKGGEAKIKKKMKKKEKLESMKKEMDIVGDLIPQWINTFLDHCSIYWSAL